MRALLDRGVLQELAGDQPLHERIAEIFGSYDEAVDRAPSAIADSISTEPSTVG